MRFKDAFEQRIGDAVVNETVVVNRHEKLILNHKKNNIINKTAAF